MRVYFKITSILMLIGGIVSLLLGIGMLLFSSLLVAIAGRNGAGVIIYPVLYAMAGIAELTAGVFGLRSLKRPALRVYRLIWAIITIVLVIAVILVALIPLSVSVPWFSWVLSLIVPVLFLIFALLEK